MFEDLIPSLPSWLSISDTAEFAKIYAECVLDAYQNKSLPKTNTLVQEAVRISCILEAKG